MLKKGAVLKETTRRENTSYSLIPGRNAEKKKN